MRCLAADRAANPRSKCHVRLWCTSGHRAFSEPARHGARPRPRQSAPAPGQASAARKTLASDPDRRRIARNSGSVKRTKCAFFRSLTGFFATRSVSRAVAHAFGACGRAPVEAGRTLERDGRVTVLMGHTHRPIRRATQPAKRGVRPDRCEVRPAKRDRRSQKCRARRAKRAARRADGRKKKGKARGTRH